MPSNVYFLWCHILAANFSVCKSMSHNLPHTISTQRVSWYHALSHMATSRLTPDQAAASLQLRHTRLTATAGRCEYPYRKRCNLLVTVYHFLCQSFGVYAQDRLKKLEAAGLQGACSRVCREIRKDLDAQHKTMRQIRVHQRANIQGGRRLPYQHCLFE